MGLIYGPLVRSSIQIPTNSGTADFMGAYSLVTANPRASCETSGRCDSLRDSPYLCRIGAKLYKFFESPQMVAAPQASGLTPSEFERWLTSNEGCLAQAQHISDVNMAMNTHPYTGCIRWHSDIINGLSEVHRGYPFGHIPSSPFKEVPAILTPRLEPKNRIALHLRNRFYLLSVKVSRACFKQSESLVTATNLSAFR